MPRKLNLCVFKCDLIGKKLSKHEGDSGELSCLNLLGIDVCSEGTNSRNSLKFTDALITAQSIAAPAYYKRSALHNFDEKQPPINKLIVTSSDSSMQIISTAHKQDSHVTQKGAKNAQGTQPQNARTLRCRQ